MNPPPPADRTEQPQPSNKSRRSAREFMRITNAETGTPMHTQPNTPIDLPLIEIAAPKSYY